MYHKSPAFQWYPKDFDSDETVKLMTLEEVGAYVLLLNHCWLEGSIPSSPELIAKILRTDVSTVERVWLQVSKKFKRTKKDKERFQNDRLERERKFQKNRRKRLSKIAKIRHENQKKVHEKVNSDASCDARALQQQQACAVQEQQRSSSPSASPSASANSSYLKKEKRKRALPVSDDRRQPFLSAFIADYEGFHGKPLFTDDSDYVAATKLLKATQGKLGLDDLLQSANRFIRSAEDFHRNQGHPLRWFCANINAFLPSKAVQIPKRLLDNMQAGWAFVKEGEA